MAVTVGTDVYISLEDANTYWTNKNNSVWASASDADKEKALREATQYMDSKYSFIGWHSGFATQKLAWPRIGVEITTGNFKGVYYDSETIPPQIGVCCAELAVEALSNRIEPAQARGGKIKKEKVGDLEVEYTDFAPSAKTYGFAKGLLSGLIKGSGNTLTLKRV